eukprot:CAMPEP_0113669322 /NCGR_PEP_ID=MMETSP0038_2-20120614/4506_1 /TAXON_ID=2898 /ORGANISM="Cryptomonas paramecium" /LENGTH=83 /DNA_ID=CAMNT_0000585193 /DNA_START=43 /DNA_END=294 /DNA_ORIENTATION=+ /assembly_acc=CAM_ASM_000170
MSFGGTLIGIDADDAAKSWVIDTSSGPNGMTRINLYDSVASQSAFSNAQIMPGIATNLTGAVNCEGYVNTSRRSGEMTCSMSS